MRLKFRDLLVEGNPEDVYMFYTFCKFDKHFEKQLKKEIKRQQEYDFDTLWNKLNGFKED